MKMISYVILFILCVFCLSPCIHASTNSVEDWNAKGLDFVKNGKYQEALDAFDNALLLDPNDVDVWMNKGATFNHMGKGQEALEVYEKALSLDPKCTFCLINQGNAFFNMGKNQEALNSYAKALSIDPDNADALFSEGFAFVQLGKYSEAVAAIDKALEINPNLPDLAEIWNQKGIALANLGKYQEALDAFNKSLSINPNSNAKSFKEDVLAQISATSKNPKSTVTAPNKDQGSSDELNRAKTLLERIDQKLSLNPTDPEVLKDKEIALTAIGFYSNLDNRTQESLDAYNKALLINSSNSNTWERVGYELYKLGRYQEASDAVDKAISLNPNNDLYWLTKSSILEKLGNTKGAQIAREKSLSLSGYSKSSLNPTNSPTKKAPLSIIIVFISVMVIGYFCRREIQK